MVILLSKAYLVTSGDIFVCHNWFWGSWCTIIFEWVVACFLDKTGFWNAVFIKSAQGELC